MTSFVRYNYVRLLNNKLIRNYDEPLPPDDSEIRGAYFYDFDEQTYIDAAIKILKSVTYAFVIEFDLYRDVRLSLTEVFAVVPKCLRVNIEIDDPNRYLEIMNFVATVDTRLLKIRRVNIKFNDVAMILSRGFQLVQFWNCHLDAPTNIPTISRLFCTKYSHQPSFRG